MSNRADFGGCERCSQWLAEAQRVRQTFHDPAMTRELEVSARLRLNLLAQRLVLHECTNIPRAASA